MFEVKSKYKNPDQYIKKLKYANDYAWNIAKQNWDEYEKELGPYFFKYEGDSAYLTALFSKEDAQKIMIMQEVKAKGYIYKIERKNKDEVVITMVFNEVRKIKGED